MLLLLLYVHRSAQSKISFISGQMEALKQSTASNTVSPEDVEHVFDRKMREMESRRMEAMKQMRDAHAKQMQETPNPNAVPQPTQASTQQPKAYQPAAPIIKLPASNKPRVLPSPPKEAKDVEIVEIKESFEPKAKETGVDEEATREAKDQEATAGSATETTVVETTAVESGKSEEYPTPEPEAEKRRRRTRS